MTTTHQMRPRRLILIAVVATLGLVAAACGGGRSTSADGDGSTPTSGASTSTGSGDFGTLASPCGPGSPSGAPTQGVDSTTITIGYGDDAGYATNPGTGHEASDAVKALISWCNEQGGINGRTIKGNYYDAAITNVVNAATEACGQAFALVGQAWALSQSAEQTRIECGLPTVVGTAYLNSPLQVAAVPSPVDQFNVAGYAQIAQNNPEAVKKTAIMEPNFPAVITYDQQFQRTATTVGWGFLDCTVQYPITGVTDYRPYLQRIKDCGATTVFTTDQGTNFINMLDAAKQIEFSPLWVDIPNIYTESFASQNVNGNADGVLFANQFVPLAYTPEGSANALYTKLVQDSGGDTGYVGQGAASAFLLWATAAKECGNDLTRTCLMEKLKAIHEWTGGGLHSVQDPGENSAGTCGLVISVKGQGFEQVYPSTEGEFVCDPAWSVTVSPLPDTGLQMNLVDRVATQYTPPANIDR